MTSQRERIDFDVLFVGGGPANLAGAIRLMTLAAQQNLSLEVALIEKGKQIGSHAVSGAVFNPRALEELIPDYLDQGFPMEKKVRGDRFFFLTEKGHHVIPWTPPAMRNTGFYTVSLSKLNRWLAEIAESLGVCIFTGFSGKEVLFAKDKKTIIGVRTGDKGLDREGKPKKNFEPGMDLMAKTTIFGEGPRGSLMNQIDKRLGIFPDNVPQTFETAIKEVIALPDLATIHQAEIHPAKIHPAKIHLAEIDGNSPEEQSSGGQKAENEHFFRSSSFNDIHTMGYPLGINTPGGGFIYEMDDNRVALGFITGLSYTDPLLDPYEEFIKFKRHPFIASIIKNGRVVEQGARTIAGGGYYSLPKLAVDGAMFVGGCASIQNLPALKGIHVSMKSGMLAAEAALKAFKHKNASLESLALYPELFAKSWANEELYQARNFAQALARKGVAKLIHLGAQTLTKGKGFIDPLAHDHPDHATMAPLKKIKADRFKLQSRGDKGKKSTDQGKNLKPLSSNVYDGKLYVNKLTGVYLSKTMHREDQPCHLVILDPSICTTQCYETYGNPCTRFCPGNVYEMETSDGTGTKRLKLNPSNCLHCKTCEIKDPFENILWTCPEGGDGPNYAVL